MGASLAVTVAAVTLGNVGVALIVVTYLLLQTGRLPAASLAYSALNLLGSLLIALSLCVQFNLPSAVVEAFWILISLLGLVRWARRRARAHAQGTPDPEAPTPAPEPAPEAADGLAHAQRGAGGYGSCGCCGDGGSL